MKATGIVRRIDDLGRVVIPKEIRRTLRIREGDPLEIYTEKDGGVIFRKYSPMSDLGDFASEVCEAIHKSAGFLAAVADRDGVIASAGAPKRELADRPLPAELGRRLSVRLPMLRSAEEPPVFLTERYLIAAAAPILAGGDLMGAVLLLQEEKEEPPAASALQLAEAFAGFLGRQLED